MFDIVDLSKVSERIGAIQEKKVDSIKYFIELVQDGYRAAINKLNVTEQFADSFPLLNGRFAVDYYLSTSKELLIEVYKSNKNILHVYGTRLPVQLYLSKPIFLNEDILNDDSLSRLVMWYDSVRVVLSINQVISIGALRFNCQWKCASFESETYLFLNGTTFAFYQLNGKDTVVNKYEFKERAINILTASNSLNRLLKIADIIGVQQATADIQALFISSEYFRDALANAILEPLAEQILVKYRKSRDDVDYKYPISEFQHDKKEIERKMDSFNVKLPADSLFSDAGAKMRVGTALWPFSGYKEFEIQWVLALLAVLTISILIYRFNWIGIIKQLNILEKASPGAVSAAVFAYFFLKLPEGMSIKYWLFPTLIAIVTAFVPMFIKPKVRNLSPVS